MSQTPHARWTDSSPRHCHDAFVVHKQTCSRVLTATCEVRTHRSGWELGLSVEGRGVQRNAVVPSLEARDATAAAWLAAMLDAGWR